MNIGKILRVKLVVEIAQSITRLREKKEPTHLRKSMPFLLPHELPIP